MQAYFKILKENYGILHDWFYGEANFKDSYAKSTLRFLMAI